MKATVDTIVARATPPGYGGVGIVRVSGPLAKKIAENIVGFCPPAKKAVVAKFKNTDQIIDEGVVLFFENPHSFTGEDVLELQGHGGPMVIERLIQTVVNQGARLANPGEFSERAFLNNKIDLVQAEAIADLIHANSEQAARFAIRSLQGDFSKLIHTAVEKLIKLRTFVEAAIDFVDEDIDFISQSTITNDLNHLNLQIEKILYSAQQGVLFKDGITAVIAGKPNAGKSSLLNALSGRYSAIVTEIPGTTRDLLREHIHIDGIPLNIIDTAGLRITEDRVELEGVKRAQQEIENADLILWVSDAATETESVLDFSINTKGPKIYIQNKIDLLNTEPSVSQADEKQFIVNLSAKNNQGIDLLKTTIKNILQINPNEEGLFLARKRHVISLERSLTHIQQAQRLLEQKISFELLAEELRLSQNALSEITGQFTTDDLLGKIFSTFCIGK